MSKKFKNRFDVVQAKPPEKTMIEDIAELKKQVAALQQVIGIPGPKGDKGDTGAQGKQGETGKKGGFSLVGG